MQKEGGLACAAHLIQSDAPYIPFHVCTVQKAELEAAEKAAEAEGDVWARLGKNEKGSSAAPGGKSKGKGKTISLTGKSSAPAAAATAPPKADPAVAAWIKNRPKGGVKVLSGSEGALGKRSADGEAGDAPATKK